MTENNAKVETRIVKLFPKRIPVLNIEPGTLNIEPPSREEGSKGNAKCRLPIVE